MLKPYASTGALTFKHLPLFQRLGLGRSLIIAPIRSGRDAGARQSYSGAELVLPGSKGYQTTRLAPARQLMGIGSSYATGTRRFFLVAGSVPAPGKSRVTAGGLKNLSGVSISTGMGPSTRNLRGASQLVGVKVASRFAGSRAVASQLAPHRFIRRRDLDRWGFEEMGIASGGSSHRKEPGPSERGYAVGDRIMRIGRATALSGNRKPVAPSSLVPVAPSSLGLEPPPRNAGQIPASQPSFASASSRGSERMERSPTSPQQTHGRSVSTDPDDPRLDDETFANRILNVLADRVAQPPTGFTGIDPRLGPIFPGAFGRGW